MSLAFSLFLRENLNKYIHKCDSLKIICWVTVIADTHLSTGSRDSAVATATSYGLDD
jgi:hypothetical protein